MGMGIHVLYQVTVDSYKGTAVLTLGPSSYQVGGLAGTHDANGISK